MNLKKNLLMILLLIVLMPMLSAQTLPKNKKISENELGIDLTKTYNGNEVNEIISIILDEADNSIEAAYKEGYKQATIELKPEVEYWKTLYENKESMKLRDYITCISISFATGFIAGGCSGYTIGMKIPLN